MGLKTLVYKLLFKEKASSGSYINHLRSLGMTIGENCTIFTPRNVLIDTQYPWMVTIGNNVQIAQNVSIIDHDYSWSVLKHIPDEYGEGNILGASGKITIGNNVFIGVCATILRGTTIGDNVIIGANSLVSGTCESNSVYAGNPAKRIMSIEDFYAKRQSKQAEEAKCLAEMYYVKFGKLPDKEVFHEYFMLFENNYESLNSVYQEKLLLTGNGDASKNYLQKHHKKYQDFETFLSECNLMEKK